jgi:Ser/Thr protein kinase RdoA (MazF antagonist)
MTQESPALAAIAVEAPNVAVAAVAAAVEEQFGLAGEYAQLVSERDQNFMLCTDDGDRFVVKVTCESEEPAATDFQIGALLHLETCVGPTVPRVVRTRAGEVAGEIDGDGGSHSLRVASWVAGELLEEQDLDERNVAEFGRALAQLDMALDGYSHPGESPVLLWDLHRVRELRSLVSFIDAPHVQSGVARAIGDFDAHVVPALGGLRSQVIHSDANPGNVLLSEAGIGFIDFGDILKAPLIFDVAIAASYLRSFDGDPLRFLVPFVAAYHQILPLVAQEADHLFDLVRARLATTITLLYWRLSSRGEDDPYRQKALLLEVGAEKFLAALDAIGADEFRRKLQFIQ